MCRVHFCMRCAANTLGGARALARGGGGGVSSLFSRFANALRGPSERGGAHRIPKCVTTGHHCCPLVTTSLEPREATRMKRQRSSPAELDVGCMEGGGGGHWPRGNIIFYIEV
jgi:hypothetical protein